MQTFIEKLNQTRLHFQNNDLSLGFRLLVDCVLDTRKTKHYKSIISLTEWKESDQFNDNAFKSRVGELLNELEKETVLPPKDHDALLIAEELFKRYGRNKFKIGAISMQIKAGEVWGLVGENGNGKTTLLRMLAQDLSYDTGKLSYPFDANSSDLYDLRTKLTYIPQRTSKWYGSLKANLKFTAAHYGITGEENELLVLMMIIRFGLWNFRNHQWSELSSGYKMRFELARTFLRAPKILLLDEPLANLDVLAQQLVLEDLKSLSKSISNPIGIVLSSQQLFEVEKIADHVLFLRQGVPKFLNEENDEHFVEKTVIECDLQTTREQLLDALSELQLDEISFNGGIYILTFKGSNQMHAVMAAFVKHAIVVTYIRDISQSTRRLFLK